MLISKGIRYEIFKTREIMKRIQINFKASTKQKEISQFLSKYGIFIRNVGIMEIPSDSKYNKLSNFRRVNPRLVPYVLNNTPNIEEFEHKPAFRGIPRIEKTIKKPFILKKLRHLSILTNDVVNFISNAKEVKNLKTLKVDQYEIDLSQILTDFILSQDSLKELTIKSSYTGQSQPFPSSDISKLVKFKLTKFEFTRNNHNEVDKNFLKFLVTQAETLEDLCLSGPFPLEIYNFVLKRCKNLTKLELFGKTNFNDSPEILNTNSVLEKLRFFSVAILKLDSVYEKFPNLNSVKCGLLVNVDGVFDKLESLEIYFLDCRFIYNFKLHSLKELKVIHSIEGEFLENFLKTIPNLEHFEFIGHGNFSLYFDILKNVKNLKRLQNLKIFTYESKKIIFMDFCCQTITVKRIFLRDKNFLKFVNINFNNFEVLYF